MFLRDDILPIGATAAEYRKFAAECERLAKTEKIEPHRRSILKEMADAWRNLAEKADKGASLPNGQSLCRLYP
jgi:hypothetical protein